MQIGIISLGILLIFFKNFFFHALLTDYGKMYSAYDAPLIVKIFSLLSSFGLFSLLIIIILETMCFVSKKQTITYISLLLMGITETLSFWSIQTMGRQHRLILNLPVYLLCLIIFEFWNSIPKIQKHKFYFKKVLVVICVSFMILNFFKAFTDDFSEKSYRILFSERHVPLQRNDLKQIDSLIMKLNELTANTDDYIYTLASGSILNADILRKAHMPNTDNAVPHMHNTHDVDLRDGFPSSFLNSKYIVTTDPIQTHLPNGQEVIRYLATEIQKEDSYIGRHFTCEYQFNLDNGIIAKIYHKTTEFTETDSQRMRVYFSNLYPEYNSLFTDRIQ